MTEREIAAFLCGLIVGLWLFMPSRKGRGGNGRRRFTKRPTPRPSTPLPFDIPPPRGTITRAQYKEIKELWECAIRERNPTIREAYAEHMGSLIAPDLRKAFNRSVKPYSDDRQLWEELNETREGFEILLTEAGIAVVND